MKIKYILGIFFFIIAFIIGRIVFPYIPSNWQFCFAFLYGEIIFAVFHYIFSQE